jgi:CO/xanthine dehydrogenase Mo-binding subunit
LPPVVDPFEAMEPGAPLVHEALGSNIAYSRTFTFGDVEGDFANADHVVSARLRWPRSSAMPMETNGAIGDYDEGTGTLTIYANSMNFTYFQWLIATSLKIPASKLKVVPINAGGSFGSKFFMHKVPTMAGFLSMVAGRPVKYVEDRIDHILNNDHCGSDRYYDVSLAFDNDGTLRSLKIDCVDDYGAYLQFGTGTHGNALAQVVGPYRIQSVQYKLTAVLTNKNQQGAYRGFGSEVNNWVLERMVDLAARKLGMDRAEIRRKNFIRPEQFPYKIPTGNIYDSGNYEGVLDKALKLVDYEYWVGERERARQEGRYLGIGIVTAQERSVFSSTEFWFWFDQPSFPVTSSPESATITIDPTGKFVVTLHSLAFWGNSPETVVTQVVAEEFDVDPSDIVVTYADSQHALPGTGPGGSRFTVMVTGALVGASARLKEKIKKIAAHELEVSPDDLEFSEGKVRVKGSPDRALTLDQIALKAYMFRLDLPEDIESGLEASYTYDHPYTTLPSADRKDLGVFYPFVGHACHIAVVEVDPETGQFTYHKYAAVHDCGTVVNPMTLHGHITGGAVQGLGTALFEEYVYDESGQMLTASFMDYLVPTAMDVPRFDIDHQETPSPYTPYGIKGGGEGGRMMSPGAITAALEDALEPFGVRITELPITPSKIVGWIQQARGGQA